MEEEGVGCGDGGEGVRWGDRGGRGGLGGWRRKILAGKDHIISPDQARNSATTLRGCGWCSGPGWAGVQNQFPV